MSRWFRFYSDAMRNPKVAALSDQDFRLWVELLAIAAENDGHIPPLETLKFMLKRRLDYLSRGLKGLLKAMLIDPLTDGYEPHNWSKFQYKSDTSTDRVAKHRGKGNVSVTPPETDTDTEEEETKVSPSSARPKVNVFPRPVWADPIAWADWLDVRKAKKARNTATAYAGFLTDIAKLTNAQWPPGRLLAHAAAKGWAGIYEPKEDYPHDGRSKQRNGFSGQGSTRDLGESVAAELARNASAGGSVVDIVPRLSAPGRA